MDTVRRFMDTVHKQFLGVSHGVDLTDLSQRAGLARLLAEAHLPGWDTA